MPNSNKLIMQNLQRTAKLSAARCFRRRSYDDQEGDNDINIILQPSDLADIEKRRFKYTRSKYNKIVDEAALSIEIPATSFSKNSFKSINNATSLTADLNFANCLLDQDYNLTVRLFIRKSALNWNFNSFKFDAMCCGRSLTQLLLHLFDYYNLYIVFNLDIVKVLKCFRLLEFGYHGSNPYHNSVHAADVTQAMHCFIQENKIKRYMTHLEILCSILAAVCHDLDHPGVNQSFLVATNNPLVGLYNNNSVLENHHWRFALCIFKEAKVFDHFTKEVMDDMREQLKHLILATDIARQNEYLKRFRELTSSEEFSMQKTDDRSLVLQMALKLADLGNPCRPWLISRVWSNLICDEFYRMGQIERKLGVPLTPICQREKTSIAGIQTDFFRFIVLPLLELWHKFLKSPLSDTLVSNFNHNYKRWQQANRMVQQLRRRKSVASLEPVQDEPETSSNESEYTNTNPLDKMANLFARHSFTAIKRASSDYVKSGNGRLELLRDFQLDRIIEKSPMVSRLSKLAENQKASSNSGQRYGNQCVDIKSIQPVGSIADTSKHKPDARSKNRSNSSDHNLDSECSQSTTTTRKSSSKCTSFRKALSPIEDGTTTQCHSSESSRSASLSASIASSVCSSPVMQRSVSSRTSIDQTLTSSRHHQKHIKHKSQQQHLLPKSLHHPYQQQFKTLYSNSNRRRESDPGCLTDGFGLAAAIVHLIQYQNDPLFHKRRSSLPVIVPKRRSSK